MRNAVLTVSSGFALLTLVWWLWPDSHSTDRSDPSLEVRPPSAAAPVSAPAPPTPPLPPPTAASAEPAAPVQSDEQRRVQEIQTLVRDGRVGHARALTDRFYRDFPDSPEIPALERLTGYHPRPYGP